MYVRVCVCPRARARVADDRWWRSAPRLCVTDTSLPVRVDRHGQSAEFGGCVRIRDDASAPAELCTAILLRGLLGRMRQVRTALRE